MSCNQIDCGHEWRTIPTHPAYEASSCGQIRRGRRLKVQTPHGSGYLVVCLPNGTRGGAAFRVHRLVLSAFSGPAPFEGAMALHNDGSRTNNRSENLRWGTAQDNADDAERHGSRDRGLAIRQNRPNYASSKLSSDQVREIRASYRPREVTMPDLARRFGVSLSTISEIINRRRWVHLA